MKKVDSKVVRLIQEKNIFFILVDTDSLFTKTFEVALKTLGFGKEKFTLHTQKELVVKIKHQLSQNKLPLLFIDFSLQFDVDEDFIQTLRQIFTNKIKIICLINEIERDRLVYMQEMGIDNFIVKPISINSIIQKIANTLEPSPLSQKVDLAMQYLEENKLEQAKQIIDQILKIRPNSSVAYMLLGDMYIIQKNFEQAEQVYLKASYLSKLYLEPLKKLASLYAETNNLEQQLSVLHKLDKLSPLNPERKITIGKIYVKRKEIDKGKEYLDCAIKQINKLLHQKTAEILTKIALELKEYSPELSSEYMSQAIQAKEKYLTPKDIWMFNEWGITLRRQKKFDEAINCYQKALEIDSENSHILYNLAVVYLEINQPYRSLEYAKKALSFDSDLPLKGANVAYNLAYIYYKAKNTLKAETYVNLSLKQDPKHQRAQKLLTRLKSYNVL